MEWTRHFNTGWVHKGVCNFIDWLTRDKFIDCFLRSDLSKFRPVYAPKDFLEVILSVKNTNLTDYISQSVVGLIQAPINVKTLDELKLEFSKLALDTIQHSTNNNQSSLLDSERIKVGQKGKHFPCFWTLSWQNWGLILTDQQKLNTWIRSRSSKPLFDQSYKVVSVRKKVE